MKTLKLVMLVINFTLVVTPDVWADTYYVLKFQEGGQHFVDVFRRGSDGFQDRVEHNTFKTESEAAGLYAAKQNEYESLKKTTPEDGSVRPYSQVSLWTATEAWNEEWEDRYTAWVNENLSEHYFVDHGLATDCADVAVSLRWIFSRLHGLPAGNHLAGSQVLFTQDSMPSRWENLPTHPNWWQDERFLKVLTYVQDNTYTGSVFYDLYPVAINSRAVSPGAVWLINSHHTYNVGQIDLSSAGWMKLYSSTVPRHVRRLYVDTFNMSRPVFDEAGFQRPRWITRTTDGGWTMVRGSRMPWYSLEQYSEVFSPDPYRFTETVYLRLAGRSLDPSIQLRALLMDIRGRFYSRISIVTDGYHVCAPARCPLGSAEYESWSTPQRDRRLLELIEQAQTLLTQHPELHSIWQEIMTEEINIGLEDGTEVYRTLEDLVRVWGRQGYTSDPNLPIRDRWGVPAICITKKGTRC